MLEDFCRSYMSDLLFLKTMVVGTEETRHRHAIPGEISGER
jgi:hypothetical protein